MRLSAMQCGNGDATVMMGTDKISNMCVLKSQLSLSIKNETLASS